MLAAGHLLGRKAVGTPFHIRWAPEQGSNEPATPSAELAKFQDLLRELFQLDCADLDFGIYRILNHKREVVDRYIDRELPDAVEEAVSQGAINTEAERASVLEDTRKQVVEVFGEAAIAPNGDLVQYKETPLGRSTCSGSGGRDTRKRLAMCGGTFTTTSTPFSAGITKTATSFLSVGTHQSTRT